MFGNLRALIHGRQTPKAWAKLVAMLEGWPESDLHHRVLPYLETHLEAWPDHIRRAPGRWVEDALRGRKRPELRLVRALHLVDFLGGKKAVVPGFVSEHHKARASLALAEAVTSVLRRVELRDLGIVNASGLHLGQASARSTRVALIEALAESASTRNLQALHLEGVGLTTDDVRELGRSAWAPALKTLTLCNQRPTGEALAEGGWQALEHLNLTACSLGSRDVDAIAQGLSCEALTCLMISSNPCGLPLADLLTPARCPSLETLHVGGDHGFDVDCVEPIVGQLKHLHARSAASLRRTPEDVDTLIASLGQPRLLDIDYNPIGNDSLRLLAASDALASIEVLGLRSSSYQSYDHDGLRELLHHEHMRGVRRLHLLSRHLDDRAFEVIAGAAPCRDLEVLLMETTWGYSPVAFTVHGTRAMIESPYLSARVKGPFRRRYAALSMVG